MTEIERGSTRRDENDDDRRGEYRRITHRRKASKNVENDRRIVLTKDKVTNESLIGETLPTVEIKKIGHLLQEPYFFLKCLLEF